jgi:hypothetical protein
MSNVFYESLGRVTWFVAKRKVRAAITPHQPRTKKGWFGATLLVTGVAIIGATVLSRK